jgi:uncharacterized protein YlxW (UPF0749 family)
MLCQSLSDCEGCFVCLFSLSLGVLAHLERLEAQTNISNRKSEEPAVRKKESSLRTKIRELRQQRDKLRAEVKQWGARVSREAVLALQG